MKKTAILYGRDLAARHPYSGTAAADPYYTRLANRIYETILPHTERLAVPQRKELAVRLTGYFEDVIAESGIFGAFVSEHRARYGKPLPFYRTDDYAEGEINRDDLAFLIWHFLQQTEIEKRAVSPFDPLVAPTAGAVLELLETEYETAPANEKLRDFFRIDPDCPLPALQARFFWLCTESYLFASNGEMLQATLEATATEARREGREMDLSAFVAILCGDFAYNSRTELLGYRPARWLAALLGAEHPLHDALRALGPKRSGYFRMEEKIGASCRIRHIATGKELAVASASLQGLPDALFRNGAVLYGGFVEWKGCWWLTGPARGYRENETLLEELGRSEQEQNAFAPEKELPSAAETQPEQLDGILARYAETAEGADRMWKEILETRTVGSECIRRAIDAERLPGLLSADGKEENRILSENLDFLLRYFRYG